MLQETWLNRRNAESSGSSREFTVREWSRAGVTRGEGWGHGVRIRVVAIDRVIR